SGYAVEAAPPATTSDSGEDHTVDETVRTLQRLKSSSISPLLPPQMQSQIDGVLEQAANLDNVGSAEYGRPSRGAGPSAGVGIGKAAARPADLHAGAPAPPSEPGRPAPYVDLSGAPETESRRAGAAAAGVPLALGTPPSETRAPPLFDPPSAQKTLFERHGEEARDRLGRDPSDAEALKSLAGSEMASGRYAESVAASDRALAANPSSADAFMLRAMAREAQGDMRGAVMDARQAARIDPGRHGARAAAAEAGARLFDPTSAESWGLLEKMSTPPPLPRRFPWGLLLAFFAAAAAAGGGYAAKAIWSDLSVETRGRFAGGLFPGRRGPSLGAATPLPTQRGAVALRPGAKLGAKYELIRALGRDGTVEVWKAHDTLLDRDVLLKRLYVGRDSGELDLRRQEAKQAATLHHPNIAELFEIAELPEGLFAVYEYASGKSLAAILTEKGSLSLRQSRDVLVPVCRALEHAHRRGVVHGGLSPDRIVLTRQGYVKVMDFVLARTMTAGASGYSAPEIKRGAPTPASDVYSAGIILHQMLSGDLPGEGSWEAAGPIASLLEKALDLDVRTRLASAREMLDALRGLRADTMPPRAMTPKPTAVENEERLTSEPDEDSREVAGGAVGPEDPDGPLIDPGPPTHPTNPGG
ncbi:hypothetical protein EPO15_02800, partial [bacterium]